MGWDGKGKRFEICAMSAGFVLDKYNKDMYPVRFLYMYKTGAKCWVPGYEGLTQPPNCLVDVELNARHMVLHVPGGGVTKLSLALPMNRVVGRYGEPILGLPPIPISVKEVTVDGKAMCLLAVQRRAMAGEQQVHKPVPSELLGLIKRDKVGGHAVRLQSKDGLFIDETGRTLFTMKDVYGPPRDDKPLQWHVMVDLEEGQEMTGLYWNGRYLFQVKKGLIPSTSGPYCLDLFRGILDVRTGLIMPIMPEMLAQARNVLSNEKNLAVAAGAGIPAGAGMPAGAGPAQGGAGGAGNLRRLFAADPAELVRAGLDPDEPVLCKHLVGFEKERLDGWKKRAVEEHGQLSQEMRDVKRLCLAQKETSEAQTKRMDQLGVQLVDARKGTAEVKAENDRLKAENEMLKKALADQKASHALSQRLNAARMDKIEAKLGIQRGAPDA